MKAIVLAGGGGTRLWPLSREDFPKQFIHFGSGLSLLQQTLLRLSRAPFIDEIVVATNILHRPLVKQQVEKLHLHRNVTLLVEPCRRNTAPAIALAVKSLQQSSVDTPVLVIPSDHLIEPEVVFLDALEQMAKWTVQPQIITFGIRPMFPETGYGYIQIGSKRGEGVFEVARFVEKPPLKIARGYIKDPTFYWNSGMFLFSPQTFWHQLQTYAPDLHDVFQGSYEETLARFHTAPDISIDYALMERSKEVLLCPLAVTWSDVGSWDSVYDVLDKDQDHNVKVGQIIAMDTKNCLIMGHHRRIATVGVKDLLIVETADAVFIARKGESQRVKQLVAKLQKTT